MSCAARPDAALRPRDFFNKVPEVALAFWCIKILTTTVGETCADYLAVEAGWGQGITRGVMGLALLIALFAQLRARRYVPWRYWLTVVLVSVVGTQITDLLTDGLGVSLYTSTAAFGGLLAVIFAAWHRREHTLAITAIDSPARERYYWAAILCTFALGTAAGDLATEALGLGFTWGVAVFGALLGAVMIGWLWGAPPVAAFWVAYILTRPFGAALGDLLTQSPSYGGVGLGALRTSAIFLVVIAALVAAAELAATRAAQPAAAE